MEPKIGIVICGFTGDRQFVTNPYIQSVRYSHGLPIVLPLVRSDAFSHSTWSSATDFSSAEAVTLPRSSSAKNRKTGMERHASLWISFRSAS